MRLRCSPTAGALVVALILSGCAVQSAYQPAPLHSPAAWSTASHDTQPKGTALGTSEHETWWTVLRDPAVDALTVSALNDSPTLAQAIARMDEARAALGVNSAQRMPAVKADAGAGRARSLDGSGPGTLTTGTAHAGLVASWELDLFGRVRHSVEAASSRLNARSADAQSARLSLAAQVAHSVVGLRACIFSEEVRAADIASRVSILEMTRQRVSVGALAPVEQARAISSLAGTRTRSASQREECARQTNALTRLSGQEEFVIHKLLNGPADDRTHEGSAPMPRAPEVALALPASVLAAHPAVVAAEREAAVAWADIGAARAARYPRIDLGGLLTGNWLGVGGSTMNYNTWSLAATLTAPLFDGGAGAANVDAASARHRFAEAALRQAVRVAAQEVEDALAGTASARRRTGSAQEALAAARVALSGTQAQWEAGAVSLFELEDARRQLTGAEEDAIAASRDSVQAWIALVEASGNTAVASAAAPQPNEQTVAVHDSSNQ